MLSNESGGEDGDEDDEDVELAIKDEDLIVDHLLFNYYSSDQRVI
jgi:hypothetical protein